MAHFNSQCCNAEAVSTTEEDPIKVREYYYKCTKCKKGCHPITPGAKDDPQPKV